MLPEEEAQSREVLQMRKLMSAVRLVRVSIFRPSFLAAWVTLPGSACPAMPGNIELIMKQRTLFIHKKQTKLRTTSGVVGYLHSFKPSETIPAMIKNNQSNKSRPPKTFFSEATLSPQNNVGNHNTQTFSSNGLI